MADTSLSTLSLAASGLEMFLHRSTWKDLCQDLCSGSESMGEQGSVSKIQALEIPNFPIGILDILTSPELVK